VIHKQQGGRGELRQEGGGDEHVVRGAETERLVAGKRRLGARTERLEAISKGLTGSTDNSDLVKAFPDVKKHAKVSNAGKAVDE